MLAFYVAVLVCVAIVNGHPDGAPLTACDTMTPVHTIYTPQPTASPFEITVSSTSVAVNEAVHVTLSATDGRVFQGFLLKGLADGQDTGVAGTFSMTMISGELGAMPCKYLDCNSVGQSALTHVDATNKTEIMVDWASDTAGAYYIYGTVAQEYSTFWVKFASPAITVA